MRLNEWGKNAIVITMILFRVIRSKPRLLILGAIIAVLLTTLMFVSWQHNKSAQAQAAQQKLHEAEQQRQVVESEAQAAQHEAEQKKQDAENAVAELKAYRIRYLGNYAAHYSIAIMVANENGQPNESLGQSLCTILNTNDLTTTASLFTPSFIADGLFNQTLAGSKEAFAKLDLTNVVQNIMLARQSVEYSTNSALDGLVTATMALDVSAYSTGAFQLLFADNVKVAGAGLTRLEARTMAESRILKQLEDGRLEKIKKEILAEAK